MEDGDEDEQGGGGDEGGDQQLLEMVKGFGKHIPLLHT
jgi:hypothetical protein